jgi:hypothetical protein
VYYSLVSVLIFYFVAYFYSLLSVSTNYATNAFLTETYYIYWPRRQDSLEGLGPFICKFTAT